jgi:hypothetical protein
MRGRLSGSCRSTSHGRHGSRTSSTRRSRAMTRRRRSCTCRPSSGASIQKDPARSAREPCSSVAAAGAPRTAADRGLTARRLPRQGGRVPRPVTHRPRARHRARPGAAFDADRAGPSWRCSLAHWILRPRARSRSGASRGGLPAAPRPSCGRASSSVARAPRRRPKHGLSCASGSCHQRRHLARLAIAFHRTGHLDVAGARALR